MALEEIECDKHVLMAKSCPKQLQAALYSILSASGKGEVLGIGDCYDAYLCFCSGASLRALGQRAFSDLVSELDTYGFIRVRLVSRGRYGRRREILIDLPREVCDRLRRIVLMEFDLEARAFRSAS